MMMMIMMMDEWPETPENMHVTVWIMTLSTMFSYNENMRIAAFSLVWHVKYCNGFSTATIVYALDWRVTI